MKKGRIGIAAAIIAALAAAVALGLILYGQTAYSGEYVPADDEIALQIQLDTEEDIGLLVFDYCADGREYSGGMSNADKSLMRHDEKLVEVWKKEMLGCSADTVELSIRFRIITEYADPNFENIYAEDITESVGGPLAWTARFGESYYVTISGGRSGGYRAVLEQQPPA